MSEILCPSCQHFAPALDPTIVRAFLGGCRKKEYPFTLILPLPGATECDVYQRAAKPAVIAKREAKVAPVAAATPAQTRVELCYSPKHAVGQQYPCDVTVAPPAPRHLHAQGRPAEEPARRDLKNVFLL